MAESEKQRDATDVDSFERLRAWPLLPVRERTVVAFDLVAVNLLMALPLFFVPASAQFFTELIVANAMVLLRLRRVHHRTLSRRLFWVALRFSLWFLVGSLLMPHTLVNGRVAASLVAALIVTAGYFQRSAALAPALRFDAFRSARHALLMLTLSPRRLGWSVAAQACIVLAFGGARISLLSEPLMLTFVGAFSLMDFSSASLLSRLPISRRQRLTGVLLSEAIATTLLLVSAATLGAIACWIWSLPVTLSSWSLISLLTPPAMVFAARLCFRVLAIPGSPIVFSGLIFANVIQATPPLKALLLVLSVGSVIAVALRSLAKASARA